MHTDSLPPSARSNPRFDVGQPLWLIAALTLMSLSLFATMPAAAQTDTDGDGIFDDVDNCLLVPNGPSSGVGPSQYDADADGFGNLCDADLNGDGLVGGADLVLFANSMGTLDPAHDLNGNGVLDGIDFVLLREATNRPPGPSALAAPPPIIYTPGPPPVPIALAAPGDVQVRYLVDEANTDGVVHGNLVTGLVAGDRVTIQVEVENAAGNDVYMLFVSSVFDPTAVDFLGGTAAEEILDEGGLFGPDPLEAFVPSDLMLALELRYGRDDTVLALAHAQGFSVTEGPGPDIASTMEFEVTTTGPWTGTIAHALSPFDENVINGATGQMIAFGPNVLLAVPEPSFAMGLASAAGVLATQARVRRRSAARLRAPRS